MAKQHTKSKANYEKLLNSSLECFRCDETFSTIPRLKDHLRQEFDKLKIDAETSNRKTKRKMSVDDEPDERSESKHRRTLSDAAEEPEPTEQSGKARK